MRALVALVGWPEAAVPEGGWTGADAHGRALGLGYLGESSGEAAPVIATNERRTVRAVLVGTLFNRRELRASLAGRHTLGDGGDAEVVVHLYEERGVQCVKALRGAFALVLWDERRQRLLLARDQLGLLPLFYAADHARLALSSTLPVLVGLPGLADTWDAAALDSYLTLGVVVPPATFHPAIRQLAPGELALWEDGRLKTQPFWQLTFPERRMTRDDFSALFRAQTLEALRLRQTGVVSGLLLSGGIGAAALLALATVDRRPPARAYTVVPSGADGSEAVAAEALARRAGVAHVLLREPPDWVAALDGLLAVHGSPVGGPAVPLLRLAVARAAEDGLGVVLAGTGGEEIFGGSSAARHAERLRRYRRLPALAREGAEVWARLAPEGWTVALRRLIAEERLAPLEMYARAVSQLQPEDRAALYTAETLAAMGDTRPLGALTELFAAAVAAGADDAADAIHQVELTLRLPARAAAAAAAAAGGVELRLPLADHRLAQFVASVPPVERGTAGERQLLLRSALAELVPQAVLGAPHGELAPAPAAWGVGALRALVDEVLAPDRIAAQGVFRPERVARLRREHAAGTRDHAPLLWAILVTTRWLERRPAAAGLTVRRAAS
jgi:asparagine synthase (glutamine-hydrolysing)